MNASACVKIGIPKQIGESYATSRADTGGRKKKGTAIKFKTSTHFDLLKWRNHEQTGNNLLFVISIGPCLEFESFHNLSTFPFILLPSLFGRSFLNRCHLHNQIRHSVFRKGNCKN